MILVIVFVVLIILCISQYNQKEELNKKIRRLEEENEVLRKKISINSKDLPDEIIAKSLNENKNLVNDNTGINENIEQKDEFKKNTEIIQNTQIEQSNKINNNSIKESNNYTIEEKSSSNVKENIKPVLEKNKVKNEQERKNTTILATGATFIILAAIVLLTSTWHVMPNIIKTGILLLIAVIFFALSAFAKEKKLHKASRAFYYIAMAYIPIFFISISAFGLLGKYLSINGEGKYIYFTIAGIFNSFVYYIEYKRKNMPELLYGSILTQVFTVIMFACIFETSIQNIVFCTLLYNIEFILLTKNNKFLKENSYIYTLIPYFGLVCCAFFAIAVNSFIVLCDLVFLAINFLILYFKDKNIVNFGIFNTVINVLGFYLVWKTGNALTLTFKNIIAVLYFIIINGCIIEVNKNKNIKLTSIIELLVCMQIVFFWNITDNIGRFIITLIQLLISIYSYTKVRKYASVALCINVLIFLYTILSQLLLYFVLKISSYQWFIFSGIFTFIIYEILGKLIIKNKDIKKANFYMSHMYIANVIVLVLIFNLKKFCNNIFDWIIITLVYAYSTVRIKEKSTAVIFKYLTYIATGLTLLVICNYTRLPINAKLIIPSIIVLAFLGIEPKINIKSDTDYLFKAILYLVSYLCIAFIQGIWSLIIAIVLTIIIFIVSYFQEEGKDITKVVDHIIPLLGLIIVGLITAIQKRIDPFILQIIYLGIAVGNSVMALFKKEKEWFTITAGIYLLMTVFSVESKYFGAILFLIWNFYNYFIVFKESNYQKLFKVIIYVNLLVLYNFIIGDLNLNIYATARLLGYLAISIAISDIVQENIEGPFKEIAVTIINLYALTAYLNNLDGMLFTLILLCIVLYSYYKKSGNLFMVTIANIIINIFALTRKFWFSVPWWVYLLVVGSVLIGFAVKNEANENKSISKGIVDNIKSIKDKIDNG